MVRPFSLSRPSASDKGIATARRAAGSWADISGGDGGGDNILGYVLAQESSPRVIDVSDGSTIETQSGLSAEFIDGDSLGRYAVNVDETIYVREFDGTDLFNFTVGESRLWNFRMAANGMIVAGVGSDDKIEVYDYDGSFLGSAALTDTNYARSVNISSDGSKVVTVRSNASDKVFVYDTSDMSLIDDSISSRALDAIITDSYLFLAEGGGDILCYDLSTFANVWTVTYGEDCGGLFCDENEEYLYAVTQSGPVKIDIATGTEEASLSLAVKVFDRYFSMDVGNGVGVLATNSSGSSSELFTAGFDPDDMSQLWTKNHGTPMGRGTYVRGE